MNRLLLLVFAVFFVSSAFSQKKEKGLSFSEFQSPSTEYQSWVYWYWMNGNVSKEGAIADIRAMAEVGIGGVFLMDIGIFPQGPVMYRSPEWWDIVHAVAEECAKHDMKISFSCPGWATAGGPWITPETAMKEVVWSEAQIRSGTKVDTQLPQPITRRDYYEEIATFAFPSLKGTSDNLLKNAKLETLDGEPINDWEKALSEKNTEKVKMPQTFIAVFENPVNIRSLFFNSVFWYSPIDLKLSVWNDATSSWDFHDRVTSRWSGYSYHKATGSFDEIKTKKMKFEFGTREEVSNSITYMHLGSDYRIDNWANKAGFSVKSEVGEEMDESIAPAEIINLDELIDISKHIDPDGKLVWDAPKLENGREWTILRMGYTIIGRQTNPFLSGIDQLEVDKMSKKAAFAHYHGMWDPVLERLEPELSEKVLFSNHIDSYEAGWQNWTQEMANEFSQRSGYDLRNYLPALTGRVVKSKDETEKFLWDFRKVISELFADNFYGEITNLAAADGIAQTNEPYGGPFDHLDVGTKISYPMVETLWPFKDNHTPLYFDPIFAGRTTGKGRIGWEAYTTKVDKLKVHPAMLKAAGDNIFASGVNWMVLHVFTHHPNTDPHLNPGFTCGPWGAHIDRGNTWFFKSKPWMGYLSRCQYMLRQGKPVTDVLYYTGSRSFGESGKYELLVSGIKSTPETVQDFYFPWVPDGYQFDVVTSRQLEGLKVKNGNIVFPSGKEYKLFIYSTNGDDNAHSLKQLQRLISEGATIIADKTPQYDPSLKDEISGADEFNELIKELWPENRASKGKNAIGKGVLYWGHSVEEVMGTLNIAKDFQYSSVDGLRLMYAHRQSKSDEIYFVANIDGDKSGWADLEFRVSGKTPEIWDAETGETRYWPVYDDNGKSTKISMAFGLSDSKFIVFRNKKAEMPQIKSIETASGAETSVQFLKSGNGLALYVDGQSEYKLDLGNGDISTIQSTTKIKEEELKGPWKVNFPEGWGAPAQIEMPELISWHKHGDFGVKHFSGTAVYSNHFEISKSSISPNQRVVLDLGTVEVIAQAKINGKDQGILWRPPYQVDITEALVPGKNSIEIEVVNLWVNRLIGDEHFPDDVTKDGSWIKGGIPPYEDCNTWFQGDGWFKSSENRPEKQRKTFISYKHYKKDDELVSSGLMGPVKLKFIQANTID